MHHSINPGNVSCGAVSSPGQTPGALRCGAAKHLQVSSGSRRRCKARALMSRHLRSPVQLRPRCRVQSGCTRAIYLEVVACRAGDTAGALSAHALCRLSPSHLICWSGSVRHTFLCLAAQRIYVTVTQFRASAVRNPYVNAQAIRGDRSDVSTEISTTHQTTSGRSREEQKH